MNIYIDNTYFHSVDIFSDEEIKGKPIIDKINESITIHAKKNNYPSIKTNIKPKELIKIFTEENDNNDGQGEKSKYYILEYRNRFQLDESEIYWIQDFCDEKNLIDSVKRNDFGCLKKVPQSIFVLDIKKEEAYKIMAEYGHWIISLKDLNSTINFAYCKENIVRGMNLISPDRQKKGYKYLLDDFNNIEKYVNSIVICDPHLFTNGFNSKNGPKAIKELISCIVNNREDIKKKITDFSPEMNLDILVIANINPDIRPDGVTLKNKFKEIANKINQSDTDFENHTDKAIKEIIDAIKSFKILKDIKPLNNTNVQILVTSQRHLTHKRWLWTNYHWSKPEDNRTFVLYNREHRINDEIYDDQINFKTKINLDVKDWEFQESVFKRLSKLCREAGENDNEYIHDTNIGEEGPIPMRITNPLINSYS